MNAPAPRVRRRRLLLLRDLYANGPSTRRELDLRHPAAQEDLKYLRKLGLVTRTDRDYPDPPLWAFQGSP